MRRKNIYIVLISIGVITILLAVFNLFYHRHIIKKLSEQTALAIPPTAKEIKYKRINANDENLYPYWFYAKFQCTRSGYDTMVVGHLFSTKDTVIANAFEKRLILQGRMFTNPVPEIEWWNSQKSFEQIDLNFNFFEDGTPNRLGPGTNYQGQIITYFKNGFAYIYIICMRTNKGKEVRSGR